MLELIPDMPNDLVFGQELVQDHEKIGALCRSLQLDDFKLIAFDDGCSRQLALYKRHNLHGRQESGIVYLPTSTNPNQLDFPFQMLRVFTDVQACEADVGWELAMDYYKRLALQEHFHALQD